MGTAGNRHEPYTLVVGLGHSGLACARWLYARQAPFMVADTRAVPPLLDQFRRLCPGVELVCGPLDAALLSKAASLIVAPGLSLQEPAIRKAQEQGVEVMGDVELFCRQLPDLSTSPLPVIAVTGSNGKSTVIRLLEAMADKAGIPAWVGGNIGVPVMELVDKPLASGVGPALCILELSSFQLETTRTLRARAASVLNLSQDHMDRYDSFDSYARVKQGIYADCKTPVFNRDDPLTRPAEGMVQQGVSFGLGAPPTERDFGLVSRDGQPWLVQGSQQLLPAGALKIRGEHNLVNALAALALGRCADLPLPAMLEALAAFPGLPHRCQYLGQFRGVPWFNDSKATNPAAAVAALETLAPTCKGRIVLLAGGLAKGVDFSAFCASIRRHVRALVVMGTDGPRLARQLVGTVPTWQVADMGQAVRLAACCAFPGDLVVLAPGCSSQDMFDSYEQRGEAFAQELEVLVG